MKVLHLLRRPDDQLAYDCIRAGEDEVRILLVASAAAESLPADIQPVGLAPGVTAPGRLPIVEYDEIVALVEWSDKVIAW